MKTWMCLICGYTYDEEHGDPDSGLEPGTRWEDVPLSWRCPDCGAGKEDFEMTEVSRRDLVQVCVSQLTYLNALVFQHRDHAVATDEMHRAYNDEIVIRLVL